MMKKLCFFFSLKTGAFILSFINVMCGLGFIIYGLYEYCNGLDVRFNSFVGAGFSFASLSIVNGFILVAAIAKAKERLVLLYMVFQIVILLVLTIFSGMVMFDLHVYIPIFIFCILMWYALYGTYGYYLELCEYNTTKSGVIEINFKDSSLYRKPSLAKEIENTSV